MPQVVFLLQEPVEELDRGLERAFLSCLGLWIGQITTNSKPVRASFKVLAAVCVGELLPATKNFIGFGLRFVWEPLVERAGVDEERSFGKFLVFLMREDIRLHTKINSESIYHKIPRDLEKRRVRDDGNLNEILECEVESVPGCDVHIRVFVSESREKDIPPKQ